MSKRMIHTNIITDSIIEEFYKALADRNETRFKKIYIPSSDVFYIKSLLNSKFNKNYTLEEVENLIKQEFKGTPVEN